MSEDSDSQVFNLFYTGRNVPKVWSSTNIRMWGMVSFLSFQMPTGVPLIHAQSCLSCISIWWRVGWNLGERFLLGAKNGQFSFSSCTAHGVRGLHRFSDREQHPTLSCDLQAWWVLGCPHGTSCDLFRSRLVEEKESFTSMALTD